MSEWRRVTCEDSELIRRGLTPVASLTDLDGNYGEPVVYTVWGTQTGREVLREWRWPGSGKACRHEVREDR